MKRESFDHPKMKSLARQLKVPIYAANGITARLWWFAGQYAPAGDIGRFSDDDIAEAVGFDLDRAAELISSLLSSGFLDESHEHRLIIHDWADHCEDSVHAKVARRGNLFADGTIPNMRLLNPLERDKAKTEIEEKKAKLQERAHDMRSTCARHAHEVATTLALPLPLPFPEKELSYGEGASGDASPSPVDSKSSLPSKPQTPPYDTIHAAWNSIATECGIPTARELTAARKQSIRTRWTDPSWRTSYAEAITRIRGSPFLRGENDRGWRADFDWFLKPGSVTKILEGKYDDGKKPDDDIPF